MKDPFFWLLKNSIRLMYKKHTPVFEENLSSEPAIFVCNHNRAHGPLAMFLTHKRPSRIWVIAETCKLKTTPAFIRRDFWVTKNPVSKALVRVISYLAAPLLVYVMKRIDAIGVHYDIKMSQTFRESVNTLIDDKDVIIFADHSQHYSKLDEHFSVGFVQLGRLFYKKTGKCLKFYPTVACHSTGILRYGKPCEYSPNTDFKTQKKQVGEYLCRTIMDMAHEEFSNA